MPYGHGTQEKETAETGVSQGFFVTHHVTDNSQYIPSPIK
jgi:hypothetical protein